MAGTSYLLRSTPLIEELYYDFSSSTRGIGHVRSYYIIFNEAENMIGENIKNHMFKNTKVSVLIRIYIYSTENIVVFTKRDLI